MDQARPSRANFLKKVHFGILGAAEGTRTPDPIITNDVLYQLSYCGNGGLLASVD